MSQKDRVLQYLKQGKALTRLNAWDELGVIETPLVSQSCGTKVIKYKQP